MNRGLRGASAVMAAGTLASRVTGFLRTIAMLAALGTTTSVAEVYNVANVLPNVLYDLLLGGVLTSVVVPVLVQAARDDPDEGSGLASSLLTAVTLGLGAATTLAVVAAPALADLYGLSSPASHRVAVTFLRVFLPQLAFYGIGATIGAILNTRGRFGAPMVTPVLNNLVVIGTFALFAHERASHKGAGLDVAALTRGEVLTLAVGTTLGVVVMTAALLPSLRATGMRLRPRLDLSHPGLRSAGRLAGWVLGYAVTNQLGFLVITVLAHRVDGFTAYSAAYQVFQLPYAVVGVSVMTALMPRLSRLALERRPEDLRTELSRGLRLSGMLLVPAAALLVVLGPTLSAIAFGHGATSIGHARAIGAILAAFAVGLVPFAAFQLLLRVLYAGQDSRTPFLINLAATAVNVGVDLLVSALLPRRDVAIGLAAGLSVSYAVGTLLAARVLRSRVGGLDVRRVVRMHVRAVIAAGLGALAAYAVDRVVRAAVPGLLGSLVALVTAGAVFVVLTLLAASRMRLGEVREVLGSLPGPLRRAA